GSSDSNNLTIQNRIRYVTGIVLHSQSAAVTPHLTLGPRVGAQARNLQSGITFELRNPQPINLSQVKLNVLITSANHKLPTRDINNAQMAPNSTWQAFVPYKNLKAGSYTLHLRVQAKGDYEQEFTRKFTITAQDANRLNKDQNAQHNWPIMTWIILIIILGVILVIG
ncbi:DUF3324 domain-containing protein, partial [Lactobacillus sp. XV13L]|nr:DUF3324 domain-containing protein [Lactobacillus sp. XV13L]